MESERIPQLLVGIPAVSDVLGCGRTTVYKLIAEGHLRACKLGARTLVHVDELRRFADELAASRTGALDSRDSEGSSLDQEPTPDAREAESIGSATPAALITTSGAAPKAAPADVGDRRRPAP